MKFNFCLYQKLIDFFFFYGIDWCFDLIINSYYQERMLYIELILKKIKKEKTTIIYSLFFSPKKKKNP